MAGRLRIAPLDTVLTVGNGARLNYLRERRIVNCLFHAAPENGRH